MKGTDLSCNSLISATSKAKLLLNSALSLHVHPRERGSHAGLINERGVSLCYTCRPAQGSFTAVSYPGSLDVPLNHKAESHSYLSSSA